MKPFSVLASIVIFAGTVWAQTEYGQCGGIGWAGATTCPDGWTCTISNDYYSQCLPGAATTGTPTSTVSSTSGGTATTSSTAASGTMTLQAGYSFIRAVEDPNFHKYLQSEVLNTASDAVLGSPATAAQFQIVSGQLVQNAIGTPLYAVVEPRANDTVMQLKMSWSTTPASGDNAGTFLWSGDTVEWEIASINRPQLNLNANFSVLLEQAWLVCPDSEGNADVYVNLGAYDYETPAGCADETIHAYTGATATP
ncbi:hypothetical protein EW146_g7498 [Bondarzewia mesenterica]|uniref:CBM1 domain-containing protein n=1 Tax=Bondarzewia mesenterica TaxID=1095465 RepID=A0A4S4LKS0_9AGAM|nr:hypothetical protein EW146_g7498 [Bondarzewia mesenterica]